MSVPLILICVTILTVLAIICFITIYHCFKKHICFNSCQESVNQCDMNSDAETTRSMLQSPQKEQQSPSPSSQTIPTVQIAVDTSPKPNGSSNQLDSLALQPASREKTDYKSNQNLRNFNAIPVGSLASNKITHLTSMAQTRLSKYSTNQSKQSEQRLKPKQASPTNQPQVSMISNSFTPNPDITSKKEFVLFKAASFTE